MGWVASRIRLKWREPRAVRRYLDRLEEKKSYWYKGVASIFTVGIGMLIWWLAVLNPKKDPPPFSTALALSIGLAIVAVHLPALVYRYASSTIMVQKDWIRRIRGNSFRDFRYKDIESYNIEWKTLDGRDFPVLSITLRNGKAFAIGIASSVALDELEKILSERISLTKCEDLRHDVKNLNPNL